MFDYDFWTRDINRRVEEAGGDGAVVRLVLNDGRGFYVRKVVRTRSGTVALDVYDPNAAKPIVQSTSEVYLIDIPVGKVSSLTVAFESISDVQVRRTSPDSAHLRIER